MRVCLKASITALCLGMSPTSVHAQCEPLEVAKLVASDAAEDDEFGWAVAISGDTAVVGVRRDDDLGTNSGSAWIFTRAGDLWFESAKLLANDGESNDWFGLSVSVSGFTAMVGAPGDDAGGPEAGAAYVFEQVGGVWTQTAKLTASEGSEGDHLGYAVSISGDTAIAGAALDDDQGEQAGAVYVFERIDEVWTEVIKLTASDTSGRFGEAVSLSGETALIGADSNWDNGTNSGAAYVFERSGGDWMETAKLLPDDGYEHDHFGRSVAVGATFAVVGAYTDDDNGDGSGSAYVFHRLDDQWIQTAKLTAADGTAGDAFGNSVAIDDTRITVGAYFDDDHGQQSGSAYVFEKVGADWVQVAKLVPSDGMPSDNFGTSLSISGETAIVGASQNDAGGSGPGTAYVFDLCRPTGCPPDLTGDGLVDTLDFLLFLGAWGQGLPLADWDNNGTIDTLDFLAYLNDWVEGC
jgi:hypothetical protein